MCQLGPRQSMTAWGRRNCAVIPVINVNMLNAETSMGTQCHNYNLAKFCLSIDT
jgi:hypothetical protein